MTISIVATDPTGLVKCLLSMGYRDLSLIPWARQPYRIARGKWRAEVMA